MAVPLNQSMGDIVSQDESIVNEEESNANETASENHPVTLEVASEDPSNSDGISTGSRPGLLSLPPEVRVLVFRHLLLEDHSLTTSWAGALYQPFPAILRTGRLIRREAFQVMYGENIFYISSMHPMFSILVNRPICDAIQNVRFDVWLTYTSLSRRRLSFINLIREFGSPTIIRGTLRIVFHISSFYRNDLLNWFTRALPRFTNFRVILMEFVDSSTHSIGEDICRVLCNTHRDTFAPVFGPALPFTDGHGLQFYPQEYLNTIPPEIDVDWMELRDGIRLISSQDPPTNPEEPEA
ncbi:hypothetical protein MMC22_005999 [Lobaria immixta]|nr:hypothetical protein [Lobaria immixta]